MAPSGLSSNDPTDYIDGNVAGDPAIDLLASSELIVLYPLQALEGTTDQSEPSVRIWLSPVSPGYPGRGRDGQL
jgi:hypothetical protein